MATEAELTDTIQRSQSRSARARRPAARSALRAVQHLPHPGLSLQSRPAPAPRPIPPAQLQPPRTQPHREHPPRTHRRGHLPDRQLPHTARPHRPVDRRRHRTGPPPTQPTPIALTAARPTPAPLHSKPTRAIHPNTQNPRNTGPSGPSRPIYHGLTLGLGLAPASSSSITSSLIRRSDGTPRACRSRRRPAARSRALSTSSSLKARRSRPSNGAPAARLAARRRRQTVEEQSLAQLGSSLWL